MPKQRIHIYVDPEPKRRIELAAAKYNMSVTEYCLNAIEQQLPADELLSTEMAPSFAKRAMDEDFVASLRALREDMKRESGGKLIGIDRIIEEMREERDDEILGLR